jgi:TrmH family RNA methyltransferase
MDVERVDVVLVRPARAANVAAACRAMKNMGLRRLRLVGEASLDRAQDRALAYGAWDVLDEAQRYASLEEAVADSTLVAGTTGRDEAGAWTPRRLAEDGTPRAGTGRTALVFGPESSGLTRRELRLCHLVVHIPTSAEHSSLNLAQAVLILAYEVRLSGGRIPPAAPEDRAETSELEGCLGALQAGLLSIGYLNPEDPGGILAEIRGLVARAAPTRRELTLLRGLARQMDWAGSVASRARGSG